MKVTTQPLENHQVLLTIEIDEERVQKEMRRVARRLSKQVNIPGFRRGKAPFDRVLAYFGQQAVLEEVAQTIAEDAFREAMEQEGITPYAIGDLEIPSYEPLTLQLTVSLQPEVDLGDYRSYRREYHAIKIHQEEIDEELERIRLENVILEPVERPAEPDDVVEINITGRTPSGEVFLEDREVQISLYDDEEIIIPGLYDFIVGMSAGEERTVTVTLPDDFQREDLRGQDVEITIELLDVYEQILPAIDDDLARTVGSFDSLEELEARIAEQLLQVKKRQADEEYSRQVFDDIVAQAQVKYPPEMLDEVLDDLVEDYARDIEQQTHLSLQDYLRVRGSSEEELRESLEGQAAETLRRSLVAWEIIRREGLEVGDEEVTDDIDRIMTEIGSDSDSLRAALNTEKSRQALREQLLQEKLWNRLAAIARGEIEDDEEEESDE